MKTYTLLPGMALMALLGLTGCVTSMASLSLQGMNTAMYCPVGLHGKSQFVTNFIAQDARGGMEMRLVYDTLGAPEEVERVVLTSGADVDVWQYRVGHPRCRGLERPEFAPVVFQNGILIGAGDAYFDEHITARIVRRTTVQSAEDLSRQVGGLMQRVVLMPLGQVY